MLQCPEESTGITRRQWVIEHTLGQGASWDQMKRVPISQRRDYPQMMRKNRSSFLTQDLRAGFEVQCWDQTLPSKKNLEEGRLQRNWALAHDQSWCISAPHWHFRTWLATPAVIKINALQMQCMAKMLSNSPALWYCFVTNSKAGRCSPRYGSWKLQVYWEETITSLMMALAFVR